MALGLLGLKVGMTQFVEEATGAMVPVTVLHLGPCPVLQVRSQDRDGYDAVQIGFEDKPRRNATRGERGHVSSDLSSKRRQLRTASGVALLPKADCEPQRYIREFRLTSPATVEVGSRLTASDVFGEIAAVDVISNSKGKGFAGVIKRHGYGGLRHTHGIKKGWRQRGSSSSNASNRGTGRPKKGIRMAGRHGGTRVTARNLRVVKIDTDLNVMLVEGAVPGYNGTLVMVRPAKKLAGKKTTK